MSVSQEATDVSRAIQASLKDNGAEMDRPTEFKFSIGFDDFPNAQHAAIELRQKGFVATTNQSSSSSDSIVVATKSIVPSTQELGIAVDEVIIIARSNVGMYDGWEAKVSEKNR